MNNFRSSRQKIIGSAAKYSISRDIAKSLSRSPIRSSSQKHLKREKTKNNPIINHVSPPRQCIKSSHLRLSYSKPEFLCSRSRISHLTETMMKTMLDISDRTRIMSDEKLKKKALRARLEEVNKRIREKNAKKNIRNANNKHPKPWGCDKRVLKEEGHIKITKHDEIRKKVKAENEVYRKERRKAIGLEFYPHVKCIQKKVDKEEKPKPKRSPDPNIQKYIKQKNKTRRIETLQKVFEEALKESERIESLEKLCKPVKKNNSKRPKKKKFKAGILENDEKSTEPPYSSPQPSSTKRSSTKKMRKASVHKLNTEFLSKQLKDLKDRISSTYDEMKGSSVIKIQRWYRKLLSKRNSEKNKATLLLPTSRNSDTEDEKNQITECEEWVNLITPPSKFKELSSNLIEKFREKLDSKHKEIEKKIIECDSFFSNRGFIGNKTVPTSATDESCNSPMLTVSSAHVLTPPNAFLTEEIPEQLANELESSENTAYNNLEKQPKPVTKLVFPLKNSQEAKVFYESISSKGSGSSSSLEKGNTSSMIKVLKEKAMKEAEALQEDSLHSFSLNKNLNIEITDKDSLDYEIGDFSSDIIINKEEILKNLDEISLESEQISDSSLVSDKSEGKKKLGVNYQKRKELDENKKSCEEGNENSHGNKELGEKRKTKQAEDMNENLAIKKINKEINFKVCKRITNFKDFTEVQIKPDSKIIEQAENSKESEGRISELCSKLEKRIPQNSPVCIKEAHQQSPTSCQIPPPDTSNSTFGIISEIIDREFSSYLQLISFQLKEPDVNPSTDFIEYYLDILYKEIYKNDLKTDLLKIPVQDHLAKLSLLQNTEIGELCKSSDLELILPIEYNERVKESLGSGSKARTLYLQMLFDCVNEVLLDLMTSSLYAMPDPWSDKPSVLLADNDLKASLQNIKKRLLALGELKGGVYPSQEIRGDEEKLRELRQKRVNEILRRDGNEEEKLWTNYDDEDAQSKLDLADIIFEHILGETVDIFSLC